MSTHVRRIILRANALWLLVASSCALVMDVAGAFFSRGPEAAMLAAVPGAAIGFIAAHGLAFILGVLLWRARPARSWHVTAVAVHLLLGTANVVFWQMFVDAGILPVGIVTTSLHFLFVAVQLVAAGERAGDEATGSTRAPNARMIGRA